MAGIGQSVILKCVNRATSQEPGHAVNTSNYHPLCKMLRLGIKMSGEALTILLTRPESALNTDTPSHHNKTYLQLVIRDLVNI